jgi:hypothetical protein
MAVFLVQPQMAEGGGILESLNTLRTYANRAKAPLPNSMTMEFRILVNDLRETPATGWEPHRPAILRHSSQSSRQGPTFVRSQTPWKFQE